MAFASHHTGKDFPPFRRGHVGWTLKRKAYFTGGYNDLQPRNPTRFTRGVLLRDIHCFDLKSHTWMHEESIPAPPTYLDGHTASQVGDKIYLLAGGTYPANHTPEMGFALDCNRNVYVLDINPKCNPDGRLPKLEWRTIACSKPVNLENGEEEELGDDADVYMEEDDDDDFDFSEDSQDEDFNEEDLQEEFERFENQEYRPNANNDEFEENAEPEQFHNVFDNPNAMRRYGEQLRMLLPNHQFTPTTNSRLPSGSSALPRYQPLGKSFVPRVWHSATVIGKRIYIIGGRDMTLTYFNDVMFFDTETETFTKVNPAPGSDLFTPRAAHGAVSPDNRHIYVFGGRYKHPSPKNGLTHSHYNDVFVFDTETATWSKLIQPPEADNSKYSRTPRFESLYMAPSDEEESETSTSNATSVIPNGTEYPEPRCCFIMTLDPLLPHKAYILGGYTSSNSCFYYLADSWVLDLLELQWERLSFLPSSESLYRSSIHTPTIFYDEVIMFSGEGSTDKVELPYAQQRFLNTLTILRLPETSVESYLHYRDPIASNYRKLYLNSNLSDLIIELPSKTLSLHKPVILTRMPRLRTYLNSTSLISYKSNSLKSSKQFSITKIEHENWQNFLRASLPLDFQEHRQTFDPNLIELAFEYAYTDTILYQHRMSLDDWVQLFGLGSTLGLTHLSATALAQISEHLDPWFPNVQVLSGITELLSLAKHFELGDLLISTLTWYYNQICSTSSIATQTLPADFYPVTNLERISASWKSQKTDCPSIAEAMDHLYCNKEISETDFELVLSPSHGSEPCSMHPIKVHSSILSMSSPYLSALMLTEFKESRESRAVIHDLPYPMEYSSLEALFRYMYGGSLSHIDDKTTALDILCNLEYFYSRPEDRLKLVPFLGESSTVLLRPRSLERTLMTHCIDVVMSGEVSAEEMSSLKELSRALRLDGFRERLQRELA